jgi:signal transduction histidine kinase
VRHRAGPINPRPSFQWIAPDKSTAGAFERAGTHMDTLSRPAAGSSDSDLAFLLDASTLLAESFAYETTLGRLAHLAAQDLGDWCAIHTVERGAIHEVAVVHREGAKQGVLDDLRLRYPVNLDNAPLIMDALRTGHSTLRAQISDADLTAAARDASHLTGLRALGLASVLCAPMVARGVVIGVITCGMDGGQVFAPGRLELARDLARRAALAVDNARLYQQAQQATEDERRLRAALEDRAAELNGVIEAIADGVFVCDRTMRITQANAAALRYLGLNEDLAPDQPAGYAPLIEPRTAGGEPIAVEDSPLARGLRGETGVGFRAVLRHAVTGEELQVRCSYAPIRDAAGEITGAVAVMNDLTMLQDVERQKDDLLWAASHELNTPITALRAALQLTTRRLRRSGQEDMAQTIEPLLGQVDRLTALVHDLLDVARAQSGSLEIQPVSMDLAALSRRLTEAMQATTEDHTLTVIAPATLLVSGDESRIEQVLTNLISNAIKYSPEGGPIAVRVEIAGREAQVCVSDAGIGIPAAERERLFERFHRATNAQAQRIRGFGLGLYISQAIVTAHGGRIWLAGADPTPGGAERGSVFCFSLPLA